MTKILCKWILTRFIVIILQYIHKYPIIIVCIRYVICILESGMGPDGGKDIIYQGEGLMLTKQHLDISKRLEWNLHPMRAFKGPGDLEGHKPAA